MPPNTHYILCMLLPVVCGPSVTHRYTGLTNVQTVHFKAICF